MQLLENVQTGAETLVERLLRALEAGRDAGGQADAETGKHFPELSSALYVVDGQHAYPQADLRSAGEILISDQLGYGGKATQAKGYREGIGMSSVTPHILPKLHSLPTTLPLEGTVRIELEEGVPIFRASETVQARIETLLEKQHTQQLSQREEQELDAYEEIDDYLSLLNRLVRNLPQPQSE